MLVLRSLVLLACPLACALSAGCPGATVDGAAEGEGEGEGQAGEGEGEGQPGVCPYATFTPCGGDIVGAWTLETVCPPEGQSLTGPCDGAFSTTAGCEGNNDAATCTQQYSGTVTLNADGTAEVTSGVAVARTETFSAACVSAGTGNGDALAACNSLTNADNACNFDGANCNCNGTVLAGADRVQGAYTVDAAGLHFAPAGADPIDGGYCVTGTTLVLTNAFGWPFWLLSR